MAGTDLFLKLIGEQVKVVETIDRVVARLEKLERGVDQVGDEAKKTETKLNKAFKKMGDGVQAFGKKILKVGVAMGATGLAASIYKSVKAASSFETKMREVSTLLGDKAEPKMKKFNEAVRKMATTTSATANELSSGLYQVISAGTKGTEDAASAMKLLDTANKMAVAGVGGVLSSVDVLTTALNAWGASADQATQFSDQMFKAIELGKLTLNDLSAGLGTVASSAAGASIEFGEVNAALATMTAAGVPPARAMTSLNAIIRVASKGSKELDKAFGETSSDILRKGGLLGVMEALEKVTEGDTIALQKLNIEQEAVTGLAVLAGTGIDKFRDSLEKMDDAAGSTESAYQKMSETFEFQTKKFWNVVNDVFISIGNKILPILIEKMEEIGNWVSNHEQDIKNFIEGAVKGIIEFGEFIIEHGAKIATLFAAIWVASLGPIGQVAAAIGAVMLLMNELDGGLVDMMERIKTGEKGWNDLVDNIMEKAGLLEGQLFKTPQEWTSKLMPGYIPPEKGKPVGDGKSSKPPKPPKPVKGVMRQKAEGAVAGVGFIAATIEKAFIQGAQAAGLKLMKDVKRAAVSAKIDKDIDAGTAEVLRMNKRANDMWLEQEKAFYAEMEENQTSWLSDIAIGFKEAIGARLEGFMMEAAGAVMKPAGQIGGLLGMVMGGAAVGDVKQQTEQIVQFWEGLTESIGPALDYLVDEGIPMIIDAFVEHLPDIVDSITEAVPQIIDVLIKEMPRIVMAVVEGIGKAFGNLLGIGGGASAGEALTGAATGASVGAAVGSVIPAVGTVAGAIVGAGLGALVSLFHEGGFVEAVSGASKSADIFANAIKAHSGLFVRPGLSVGDVPAILQTGEGVIRKEVVAAMGGEPFIDALNNGMLGGSSDTHVHLHAEHLYAKDAAEMVDDLQAEMFRRGTGKMRHVVGDGEMAGYRSLR